MKAIVTLQGNIFKVRTKKRATKGGGTRKEISEFSSKSRKNLLELTCKIAEARATFITLTYPQNMLDHAQAKADLRAFLERIRRRWPESSGLWRMEYQRRGSIHFHLLMFNMPFVHHRRIRAWWREIIKPDVQPIVNIKACNSFKMVANYVSKYIAKMPDEDEASEASANRAESEANKPYLESVTNPHASSFRGRFWGVFNRPFLPLKPEYEIVLNLSGAQWLVLKYWARQKWHGIEYDMNGFSLLWEDAQLLYTEMIGILKKTPPVKPHILLKMQQKFSKSCEEWSNDEAYTDVRGIW